MNECLNLFQEYLDLIDSHVESLENSLEDELSRELQELKQKKIQFLNLAKSIDCIRFCKISTDTEILVKRIISDLSLKKLKKTRFTQRIIPIQDTCPSNLSNILQNLEKLIQNSKISKDSVPSSFKIILKIRFNTKFKDEKDSIITKIASLIDEKHLVDLNTGQNVIMVYILQKTTFMGVVSDYFEHFTFNLESVPDNYLICNLYSLFYIWDLEFSTPGSSLPSEFKFFTTERRMKFTDIKCRAISWLLISVLVICFQVADASILPTDRKLIKHFSVPSNSNSDSVWKRAEDDVSTELENEDDSFGFFDDLQGDLNLNTDLENSLDDASSLTFNDDESFKSSSMEDDVKNDGKRTVEISFSSGTFGNFAEEESKIASGNLRKVKSNHDLQSLYKQGSSSESFAFKRIKHSKSTPFFYL